MTSVHEYSALRQTLGFLRAELRDEKAAREAAEKNARRWHALLLQERVKHLPKQTNGRSAHSFGREARAGRPEGV